LYFLTAIKIRENVTKKYIFKIPKIVLKSSNKVNCFFVGQAFFPVTYFIKQGNLYSPPWACAAAARREVPVFLKLNFAGTLLERFVRFFYPAY
jgi:hypothetical protein